MTPRRQFQQHLQQLCSAWIEGGLPSRQTLESEAETLERLKSRLRIQGHWLGAPRMLTATLDDGLGQGVALIERYARIMGVDVAALGLLQPAAAIVARCQALQPDLLGLTVLQLDSEEELAHIANHLPRQTRLIAGGAAFRSDPQLAERCGVDFVAANLAHFVDYLLQWSPGDPADPA